MKIALVSGASSGMGRSMAVKIAKTAPFIDEIWVTARRKEALLSLKKDIPEQKLRVFAGDLTDPAFRGTLGAALKQEGAKIIFLVNAAGFGVLGPEGTLTEEESLGMVRLNCEAMTAMTELSLPYLVKGARIIQFASAAAFLPQPGFAVYAATKAYVLSYSYALSEELKHRGIRVTAVCPGPVDTPFFGLAEKHAPSPVYKRFIMAKTDKVTAKALRDSIAGKQVSVYGAPIKAFRLLSKLLPWKLMLFWYRVPQNNCH